MRVAVVGAGVTGLVAGRRLALSGHEVTVYERWPGLGGQAATLDVGGGHRLERYYHHLFTSDRHIAALYDELGLEDELEWRPSSVAMLVDGVAYPFTSPGDLLRFSPLSLVGRIRVGLAVLWLQRFGRDVAPYERLTARDWIERAMGREAWRAVWGPLLRGKFGERAEDISMAWLHSKLTLRRQVSGEEASRGELLAYPRSSWELLCERLQGEIEAGAGRVLIDRPVARLARDGGGGFSVTPGTPGSFRAGHDPTEFDVEEDPERFDAVLATVANNVFEQLLEPALRNALAPGYLERTRSIDYFSALCLLLELDRPFSRFYWTNVADRSLPFVGLVEHTNFVEPARYGGRRFLYVANYLPPGHELLSLDADALLDHYEPGLRAVNPAFQRSWLRARWLFSEPAAQPIVDLGYRERMPPLQTGVPGLVLANTTQVYPEDRGTNYAVRLGEEAARAVMEGAGVPAASPTISR